jgi:LacI family transcriptional regulator
MAKSGAPTLNICFFASSLSLSIWVRALSGIEKAVSAHGHSLNFIEGGKDKLFRYLKNNTPDGMIIINPEAEFYNKLQRFYPMVRIITLGNNTYAPGASTVRAENSIGAFMAVEHLIKLGAKKITYIGPGIDSGNGAERYEGYLKALKVNGLKPQRIHNPASDAERAELVAGLKNKRLIPEAFFCFSDIVAMQLIKALNKVGFSVPEDILLAGFSNLREAEYFYPSITTVDTNHEEMGRVAAESLIGLVEGREGGRIESEISARLIIRESTMLRKGKN